MNKQPEGIKLELLPNDILLKTISDITKELSMMFTGSPKNIKFINSLVFGKDYILFYGKIKIFINNENTIVWKVNGNLSVNENPEIADFIANFSKIYNLFVKYMEVTVNCYTMGVNAIPMYIDTIIDYLKTNKLTDANRYVFLHRPVTTPKGMHCGNMLAQLWLVNEKIFKLEIVNYFEFVKTTDSIKTSNKDVVYQDFFEIIKAKEVLENLLIHSKVDINK